MDKLTDCGWCKKFIVRSTHGGSPQLYCSRKCQRLAQYARAKFVRLVRKSLGK